ncbi:MAG: S-layer homology domain-containing protein [Clostridia bacterium]|nr:S-layer homology domain-containing protein [Clostridia bacterium]
MKRRILSMFLVLIMLLSAIPVFAENTDITVYLSVSKYGEIVESKDGDAMAYVPVSLSGKDSYCLDDVFLEAHSTYYTDGSEGYASSEGDYGLAIDKLWGDTSKKFGYQVNGGQESVMGLSHIVKNGDYIDACIYKNAYPDTESYTKFYVTNKEVNCEETFTLTLLVSGYDENWNMVFTPCEGATVTINGNATEIVTDADGKATVSFENEGRYIISATKTKSLNEETVPTITAPVCVVDVINPAIEMIHGIASHYIQSNLTEAGSNLAWIVADMVTYAELFPESENILSEDKKADILKKLVITASEATTAGDLAKSILALRALGYDAKKAFTENYEKTDVVDKLIALVDNNSADVTNVYTLPYVIIALSQADGYATETQIQSLINTALEKNSEWYDLTYGTDAMTPMVLALAPYYNTNENIKNAIDEAVDILKDQQREDGLINGPEGYEAASTALAICAFSALGIDSEEIKNGEKSLIDGLLSGANADMNGFSNAFATEQGLRGLLAWKLLKENKEKTIYDFSGNPMNEANVSGAEYAPVIFEVIPSGASVTVEVKEEFKENCFDLAEGTYTYTVSASGYETEYGTIEITAEDAQNHTTKNVNVTLSEVYYRGGGGISIPAGSVKQEKTEYNKDETKENTSVEEVQKPVFSDEVFTDVTSDSWYYPSVKYAYENNLFKGTDKGFEPDATMTRAMLVTVLYRLASPDNTSVEISVETSFADVPENAWYADSIKWAAKNNIVSGISATEFAPDGDITREQLALILYRYASLNGYDTKIGESTLLYTDVTYISEYALNAMEYAVKHGIITGKSDHILAPKSKATRAEVATMLMRFAEMER